MTQGGPVDSTAHAGFTTFYSFAFRYGSRGPACAAGVVLLVLSVNHDPMSSSAQEKKKVHSPVREENVMQESNSSIVN